MTQFTGSKTARQQDRGLLAPQHPRAHCLCAPFHLHTSHPISFHSLQAQPRMTQFTGSKRVAELLARDLHGRVKLEDAGFDWKILGPDVDQVGREGEGQE